MPYTAVRDRYRKSPKGRETSRAYMREYYHNVLKHKPSEKAKRNAANRLNHYLRYGLFPHEADALKLSGCDLCGMRVGKMNIDHDHGTGEFRGVLCNPCNLMIGWIERGSSNMDKIKQYVDSSSAME
jgi:hypothetical protein